MILLFLEETKCKYKRLEHTALNEGDHLGTITDVLLEQCRIRCDETLRCRSFGYCPWYKDGSCFMFHKKITESTPQNTSRIDCFTNYKDGDC